MGATPNADALEVLYDGRDDLDKGYEYDGLLVNYVTTDIYNNDLGYTVIGTSWDTVDEDTTFHYVVDWQAKQAGLDAADLHWDFIFGADSEYAPDSVWINVRKDSATDEWVVTQTVNGGVSVG